MTKINPLRDSILYRYMYGRGVEVELIINLDFYLFIPVYGTVQGLLELKITTILS